MMTVRYTKLMLFLMFIKLSENYQALNMMKIVLMYQIITREIYYQAVLELKATPVIA